MYDGVILDLMSKTNYLSHPIRMLYFREKLYYTTLKFVYGQLLDL